MRRLADPINLAALGFALSLLVAWQFLADAHLSVAHFLPVAAPRIGCAAAPSR